MQNNWSKYISTFLVTFLVLKVTAQNPVFIPSGKDRYQQVAGRYGSNSGICLFEDGHFLLYGYATVVFGDYGFEKDHMLFYPDTLERFSIFATKNSSIGDSTRISFSGFEEASTFVQFNNQTIQKVFNDNANCFDYPYIETFAGKYESVSFFEKPYREWWHLPNQPNAFKFNIDKGLNDFMFIYNEPRLERQSFSARIEIIKKEKVLKLSNYGGDEGYVGERNVKQDNNWKEILEMKKQYYDNKKHRDTLFANAQYRVFNDFLSEDIQFKIEENYRYDPSLEMYVDIHNKDNDAYYQDNPYNDSRFLRKYIRLAPQRKDSVDMDKLSIAVKTIFFTECDGDNNVTDAIENQEGAPIDSLEMAADIINQMDTTTTIESLNYGGFYPFAVDLKNGFYEVTEANFEDYSKSILAKQPSLTQADIEDVNMDIDDRGIPIANIKFNKIAAKKFEALTRKNINKAIAIVVNKKVITMPVIMSEIKGGEVSISGGYTVEEIKEIVEQLRNK